MTINKNKPYDQTGLCCRTNHCVVRHSCFAPVRSPEERCCTTDYLTDATHGFGLQGKTFGINLTFISTAIKPRASSKGTELVQNSICFKAREQRFEMNENELESWKEMHQTIKETSTEAVLTMKWIESKKKKKFINYS